MRSRERGYDDRDSFWYAAALSASFEFGAEALFEEPSIQDLIVTPVGGWLLGRYFMRIREDVIAGNSASSELPFHQRLVLTVTDPLGALNRALDRWLGLDQRFHLQPFAQARPVMTRVSGDGATLVQTDRIYGVTFSYRW